MSSPGLQSPVNPLPPVVVALFLMIVGVEVTLSLADRSIIGGPGGVGWRLDALRTYAFFGQVFDAMLQTRQFPFEHVMRFVTYLFVHPSFTASLFSAVMLIALGKMVGEVFTAVNTLAVFIVSGIGGAMTFALVLSDPAPLAGAFPGVYGLIGAFTYLLWLRLGQLGANQLRAFTLIGFLMGIQLVFALLFGGNGTWVADVAGFVTGFAVSTILAPGGWRRLLERLRQGGS